MPTTKTIDLSQFRPTLAAEYSSYVARAFDRCVDAFGPALNCREPHHRMYPTLVRVVRPYAVEASDKPTYRIDAPKKPASARLAKGAQQYADMIVAELQRSNNPTENDHEV